MSAGRRLGSSGFWLLAAAVVAAFVAVLGPQTRQERALRDLLFVVDITGSMNVRDYEAAGQPASRLDIAKAEIAGLLRGMPCGSRAGLAIFTERRSFPLFAPAEVCRNVAPMAEALAALNWRMGWDGDSRVSSGVQSAIRLAASMNADLVFVTDGHEAPPLPYSGRRGLAGEDTVGGVLAGAGSATLSPIPKYDEDGRETGFYSVSDMVHGSRVGMAPPTATTAQGFHPRNNPYGEDDLRGNEHLSAARADYLRELAAEAGLGYAPLAGGNALAEAIDANTRTRLVETTVPLDWIFAFLALVALLGAHVVEIMPALRRKSRPAVGSRDTPAKSSPRPIETGNIGRADASA